MLSSFFHRFSVLFAAGAPGAGANGNNGSCGTHTGYLPSLWDNVPCSPDGLGPQISSVEDVLKIVGNVLRILIAISGMLAIVAILAAAIYYIISSGDAARVKKAKDILQNLVIGLILIIASYAIATYIAGAF